MKQNKRRFIFGMILLIGIFLISFGSAAYQNYNPQSQQPFTSSSLGGSFGGSGLGSSIMGQDYGEYCKSGVNFVFQIEPFSCTPTPVRSDLLEEQNVPVFCKIRGIKMNPLMDVEAIERISFVGRDYPKEVSGVNFYPARAALGGKPTMDNVGYLVINLRQQPNESAMPENVSGNLTTKVRYDIRNAFGIGKAHFYLPEMDDEDWENNQVTYSFWEGRGYLRAERVDDGGARITVYSDRYAKNLRGQNLDKIKVDSFYLSEGEESSRIYLPGFNPCMANLRLKLNSLENPDTRARLRINDDIIQLKEGEKFLEEKCRIREITKHGLSQSVTVYCNEDDEGYLSRSNFDLTISPKVELNVGGKVGTYELGDRLYRGKEPDGDIKTVYLGYVGTKGDENSLEDLYVYLVALPEDNPSLTPDQINSFAMYADGLNPADESGTFGKISRILDKAGSNILYVGKRIIKGEQLEIVNSQSSKNFLEKKVFVSDFAGVSDFEFDGENEFRENYENAIDDFDVVSNSFASEEVDDENAGEKALRKKIETASLNNQKQSLKEFCLEFEERYPSASKPGKCGKELFFSNSGITSKIVLINGKTSEITFDGIYEPSEKDYSAVLFVRTPKGEVKQAILTKNNPVRLDKTADVSLVSIKDKLDFDWPVEENSFDEIVSCYGCRDLDVDENSPQSKIDSEMGCSSYLENFHDGIDIKVEEGTSVKAVADGEIIEICDECDDSNNNCEEGNRKCSGYGNYIIIEHNDRINGKKYYSKYSHLSEVSVEVGKSVDKGEKIGESGNTGYSQGPHLDFKIFEDEDEPSFEDNTAKNSICFMPDPNKKIDFSQGTGCKSKSSFKENVDVESCKDYTKPIVRVNPEDVLELDIDEASFEIELIDLKIDSARVRISGEGREWLDKDKTETVDVDGRDYDFTLKEVNLNKVAEVSVESNMDYMESEANFSFNIGIEKRGIQLTPEQTTKRIKKLNETIKTLEDISDGLGNFVEKMQKACLVGGGAILAKNFIQKDAGLKSTARQRVMSEKWNGRCLDLVDRGEYQSQEECFIEKADEIDEDVNNYYEILQEQNNEIKEIQSKHEASDFLGDTHVKTEDFIDEYSEKVRGELDYLGSEFENPYERDKIVNIDDVKKVLDKEGYKERIYSMNDIRDIEFYLKAYKANNEDENAKEKLYSLLKEIEVASRGYREAESFKERTGLGESSQVLKDKNIREIQVSQRTTIKESKYDLNGENPNNYIYGLQTIDSKEYVIVYNSDGVVQSTYEILNGNLEKKEQANPLKIFFETYDEKVYENKMKDPKVKYFESQPYKGLPGLVPVDVDKGWYAYIEKTLPSGVSRSYDESGKINSFWLCNVGSNGIVEFNTRESGDDECSLVNWGANTPVNDFPGLTKGDSEKWVSRAVTMIERASLAYEEGVRTVGVGGAQVSVGSPMVESSGTKCTDFMSPKDCNTIFNLCDPVICPPSRCDMGGKFPVQNVVQSGVFGSVALCLPNYREGILIPVCLTGVKAGLDNWKSIAGAYRDCLQESLESGKTMGACDTLHSIYLCELFWRELKPITQNAIPNILSRITGEKRVHGGAEYLNIQSAWDNTKNAWNFLTQSYGETAYKAFQLRKTGEVGSSVCKNFGSVVFPKVAKVLDAASQPESPVQYYGTFQETPYTTATNPPISHYKVSYHIYAGDDQAAYYTVYLKASEGSSFYPDVSRQRIIDSGYVKRGDSVTGSPDFTAPEGYTNLCFLVNGQEECDFKQTTTSVAQEIVKDKYLQQQASDVEVTTKEQCIQGTRSSYDILMSAGSPQAIASQSLNPDLQNKGIVRICSTSNPGINSDGSINTADSKWKEVGYCGSEDVKCWVNTETIKDTIKHSGIEEDTLKDVTDNQLELLAKRGEILSQAEYDLALENIRELIDNEEREKAINNITQIIGMVPWNKEKARLYLMRGELYGELAKIYFDRLWNEIEKEKLLEEVSDSDSTRNKIISTGLNLEGEPLVKISELSSSQQDEMKKEGNIKTWKGADVVYDYDGEGGCNCFDSVLYFYSKAGAEFRGFENCLDDDVLSDYDNDDCGNTNDISKDMLERGDILSLGWKYESGENTAHNVIFLEWVDKEKGEARLLDWLGSPEEWEIEQRFPEYADEINEIKELRKVRVFNYELNFEEENVPGVVYAVGKPVIEKTSPSRESLGVEDKYSDSGSSVTSIQAESPLISIDFSESPKGYVSSLKRLNFVYGNERWYWNFIESTKVSSYMSSSRRVLDDSFWIEASPEKISEDNYKNRIFSQIPEDYQFLVEDLLYDVSYDQGLVEISKFVSAKEGIKLITQNLEYPASKNKPYFVFRWDNHEIYFDYLENQGWRFKPLKLERDVEWVKIDEVEIEKSSKGYVIREGTFAEYNGEIEGGEVFKDLIMDLKVEGATNKYRYGLIYLFALNEIYGEIEVYSSEKISINNYEDAIGYLQNKIESGEEVDLNNIINQFRDKGILENEEKDFMLNKDKNNLVFEKDLDYLMDYLKIKQDISLKCENPKSYNCNIDYLDNNFAGNEKYTSFNSNRVFIDYLYLVDLLDEEQYIKILPSTFGRMFFNAFNSERGKTMEEVKEYLEKNKEENRVLSEETEEKLTNLQIEVPEEYENVAQGLNEKEITFLNGKHYPYSTEQKSESYTSSYLEVKEKIDVCKDKYKSSKKDELLCVIYLIRSEGAGKINTPYSNLDKKFIVDALYLNDYISEGEYGVIISEDKTLDYSQGLVVEDYRDL